jgi:hypothetical protein
MPNITVKYQLVGKILLFLRLVTYALFCETDFQQLPEDGQNK